MRRYFAPLALALAAACLVLPSLAAPILVEDAKLRLRSADDDFGGLSGLAMAADGASFIAISDRGHFVRATLSRENGRLVGAVITDIMPINDSKGVPLTGRNTDAEGLAVMADGSLLVSFESNHRIMRHATLTSPATFLPSTEAFGDLQNNSGLEALAVDAQGVVYAIPERSGRMERPFPVYRLIDGAWNGEMSIPRRGEYLVTGADIHEGYLFVLERYYKPFGGFQSQVRRFEIQGATLSNEAVLLESRLGQYDNLEGIDVWRDDRGALRVSLISDDNFLFYQVTQLVEFHLEDSP